MGQGPATEVTHPRLQAPPSFPSLAVRKSDGSWAGPGNEAILSSISESHGSPKINFIVFEVKAPKNIKSKHPFLRSKINVKVH